MVKSTLALTILFLFCLQLNAQFRLDKMGVSSSIDRLIQTYDSNGNSASNQEITIRSSIGAKLNFILPGRLGLVTGINISYDVLNKNEDISIHLKSESEIKNSLHKHQKSEIGIPIGLYLQTFVTNSCVTYLKLNTNIRHRFHEKEVYHREHRGNRDDRRFTRFDDSVMREGKTGFEYAGADVNFSFGTYWNIKGLDAQFCLEPRFRLYSYEKANASNLDKEVLLYSNDEQVFSGMGFEVIIYKKLGKQYSWQ